MKLTFVGNLITLPYSPDHAGVMQGMKYLKEKGRISEYAVVEPVTADGRSYDLADAIVATKPDLVIHGMTDSITHGVPPLVKQQMSNVIQVFSMWDYRPVNLNYDGRWDSWRQSAHALDLITLSNRDQLDWWAKDFGVETIYWPHGCVIQKPKYDSEYSKHTVFVGDRHASPPYNERVHLIDDIKSRVPVEWINEPGGDSAPARIRIWENLPKIYHSAKTVLDISHFWDADGYASGRYFYTAGLGGCSISKRFPGCEDLYPEGTKIYFDTAEEAADKIKFYNNNEQERDKVKRAAVRHTKKHHSYMDRFEELFKKLDI